MKDARRTTAALAMLALAAGVLFSRMLIRSPQVEPPLPPSPAAPERLRPRVVDADFSPARDGEARAALARAFGAAVEAPGDEAVVGDFNGDGSPDLAVVVRPAPGHAGEVNDPVANWTVQDCVTSPGARAAGPVSPAPPAPLASTGFPPPSLIAEGERLLALVHGHRGRGWRDPDARQAYLVRGGPGGRLVARPRAAYPDFESRRESQMGDVLGPARWAGSFVYWTGGRYACGSGARPSARRAAGAP